MMRLVLILFTVLSFLMPSCIHRLPERPSPPPPPKLYLVAPPPDPVLPYKVPSCVVMMQVMDAWAERAHNLPLRPMLEDVAETAATSEITAPAPSDVPSEAQGSVESDTIWY